MADTSDYTSGKSMKNVMDDFVARFVKAAPTKKTFVRDAPRSGLCADVENSMQQSQLI
ncbi:hypothetical protein C0J52_25706 [Blattella germanica]|nr:hypothetical protein C0J52_25706 [Blattella germanica]